MSSDRPSPRQLETMELAAREQVRYRRTLTRIQVLASVLLIASTLVAWENHPRVVYHGGLQPGYVVREVSHSIGVATLPAGLLALALGLLALAGANTLRRVHLVAGWLAFACSFAALGVCVVEITQLLIGRRNWLASLVHTPAPSPLDQAVGIGVWLATLASVILVANTSRYLWLRRRQWRSAKDVDAR
jgi:hypothetical protein